MAGDAGERAVTLIATGSELGLALEARAALADKGVEAAVVSMPCVELFQAQGAAYMADVLGEAPRIVIEAGVRNGWDRYLRAGDDFIGMSSFGISAPAEQAYAHFGITSDAVVQAALNLTGK